MWNRDDLAKATFEAKEHYQPNPPLKPKSIIICAKLKAGGFVARCNPVPQPAMGMGNAVLTPGKCLASALMARGRICRDCLGDTQGEHNTKPSPSGPAS